LLECLRHVQPTSPQRHVWRSSGQAGRALGHRLDEVWFLCVCVCGGAKGLRRQDGQSIIRESTCGGRSLVRGCWLSMRHYGVRGAGSDASNTSLPYLIIENHRATDSM
jgi:hypothetical protein